MYCTLCYVGRFCLVKAAIVPIFNTPKTTHTLDENNKKMFAEEEMDFQNIALLLTATKRNTKKKIYTAATQLILFGLRSFSGTTFFCF